MVITPAFDPEAEQGYERWDALARGLREGGVEGFLEAYGEPRVPDSFRDTVKTVLRQRLSAHEHPEALADALEQVPRSRPFESWDDSRAWICRSWWWRAATRPTRSTRTRSASATRRRSRARGSSPRSPASRRSPGRAASSHA